MSDAMFRPVVLFDSDDPEFARGFNLGMLFRTLRTERPDAIEWTIRERSERQVEHIAQQFGYSVQVHETDHGWANAIFEKLRVS